MAGADQAELVADEYKLTSEIEWLTPHIQSFPVNATGVLEVDRIRFEVRLPMRTQTCCFCVANCVVRFFWLCGARKQYLGQPGSLFASAHSQCEHASCTRRCVLYRTSSEDCGLWCRSYPTTGTHAILAFTISACLVPPSTKLLRREIGFAKSLEQ